MTIAMFLDASTAYMTLKDSLILAEIASSAPEAPPRVIAHDYGWWVHVDPSLDDRDRAIQLLKRDFSPAFRKLIKYAHTQRCWWINFDQDGEDVEGFRKFDWAASMERKVRAPARNARPLPSTHGPFGAT